MLMRKLNSIFLERTEEQGEKNRWFLSMKKERMKYKSHLEIKDYF